MCSKNIAHSNINQKLRFIVDTCFYCQKLNIEVYILCKFKVQKLLVQHLGVTECFMMTYKGLDLR